MMFPDHILVGLLSLTLASALSNLDDREPIVRSSPSGGEDWFGFSVVLHQVETPDTGSISSFLDRTRLIVGAPRGTYPGGLQGLPAGDPVERAGLIYQCPVRAGNCSGLTDPTAPLNVTDPDRRLFDGDPNLVYQDPENKTDQLMGSVLISKDGVFLACAPHWVTVVDSNALDNRRPVGVCFVADQNLQGFQRIQPCSGRMVPNNPTQNFNADNQCIAGFSASIVTERSNPSRTLALTLLGQELFVGRLVLQDYNPSTGVLSGNVVSRIQITDFGVGRDQFGGFSTTTGFITNRDVEDIVSMAPRYNGSLLTGTVVIRSIRDADFGEAGAVSTDMQGQQTGEFYGYAVATADLNNDGLDEIIVGAPVYSTMAAQEVGRVYVYENTGDLRMNPPAPTILTVNIPMARFGSSLVNLGDINGDDLEDIAVGAPYQKGSSSDTTGAVYIYYGRSSADGLISTTPDQVILAETIVNNVPGIDSLHTFGFSLSSLDVDGNTFNDLLVGAYESGSAVLIRSLSVANIDVNVATDAASVQLDIDGDGSSFTLTVCASYRGRGLDNRPLSASLRVFETLGSQIQPRLSFPSDDQLSMTFHFTSTDVPTCVDVDISVKSVSQLRNVQVDLLMPLQVTASFSTLPRRPVNYNGGDPVDLLDYRDIPVILQSGNDTASITPSVGCSRNGDGVEICRPDLILSSLNITYLGISEDFPDNIAVIGELTFVLINFTYSNMGAEPALGATITFSIPDRYMFSLEMSNNIKCSRPTSDSNFTCFLPNYIAAGSLAVPVTVAWQLTGTLSNTDREDTASISISASPMQNEDVNINNNILAVRIVYAAFADVAISTFTFERPPVTYGEITSVANPQRVDQIGQRQVLTLIVANRGPSTASNTTLDIFIPTNDIEGEYYLYLFEATIEGRPCEGPFNPDGLSDPSDTSRRKRSSVRTRRQAMDTASAPQSSDITSTDEVRNCSRRGPRPSFCSRITCTISNFQITATATVSIITYLDGRFFQSETEPYVFVAHASVRSDVEDIDVSNNQRDTRPARLVGPVEVSNGSIPFIWIIIGGVVVALIIIIIVFVLLYFVGFFRRKKREEESKEAEGDFDVPPAAVTAVQANDAESTPTKKPVLSEVEVVPSKPLPPPYEDIGGTEDLQDGSVEKPDLDPEETSL